jgi:4-hydroxy-3-polyprenylbenzoate decarboxylase
MGSCRDLREFLEVLEQRGKLVGIRALVNKDRNLMPLLRLQFRGLPEEERKAFLFTEITNAKGKRYDARVAAGVYGTSRDIYALGMMCAPEEINERWRHALSHSMLILQGDYQKVGRKLRERQIKI